MLGAFRDPGGWADGWIDKSTLTRRLACSDIRFRVIVAEFIAAGLVEQSLVKAGRTRRAVYRLTDKGRRGDCPATMRIVTAPRLMPDQYGPAYTGAPAPIDQKCNTCGARKNHFCADMRPQFSGLARRPRMPHPHQSRRVWRGRAIVPQRIPNEGNYQPCPTTKSS